MHIAICDDNIADRKQMERLLKREAQKRAQSGLMIYTDSFGSPDSLLVNPMQYDLFYIDVCQTEGVNASDVIKSLGNLGVNAPIVLCCSKKNYRALTFSENVFFIDKPIHPDKLSASVDKAISLRSKAPTLIELRADNETYYVSESDILYSLEDGLYCNITLENGTVVKVMTDTYNLYFQLEKHQSFVYASKKLIVNSKHIKATNHGKITMTDGSEFKVGRKLANYFAELIRQQ